MMQLGFEIRIHLAVSFMKQIQLRIRPPLLSSACSSKTVVYVLLLLATFEL